MATAPDNLSDKAWHYFVTGSHLNVQSPKSQPLRAIFLPLLAWQKNGKRVRADFHIPDGLAAQNKYSQKHQDIRQKTLLAPAKTRTRRISSMAVFSILICKSNINSIAPGKKSWLPINSRGLLVVSFLRVYVHRSNREQGIRLGSGTRKKQCYVAPRRPFLCTSSVVIFYPSCLPPIAPT